MEIFTPEIDGVGRLVDGGGGGDGRSDGACCCSSFCSNCLPTSSACLINLSKSNADAGLGANKKATTADVAMIADRLHAELFIFVSPYV